MLPFLQVFSALLNIVIFQKYALFMLTCDGFIVIIKLINTWKTFFCFNTKYHMDRYNPHESEEFFEVLRTFFYELRVVLKTKELKDFCFRQLTLMVAISLPSGNDATLQCQDHRAGIYRPDCDWDCPFTRRWALHPFTWKAEIIITISRNVRKLV